MNIESVNLFSIFITPNLHKVFKMKKHLIIYKLIILLSLVALKHSVAQNEDSFLQLDHRMVFGGSFGLQFGTQTIVDISPMTGYRLTKRLIVGVSPTYKYYSYVPFNSSRLSSNVFGGGVFTRYYLIDQLFAHAEYEFLHYRSLNGTVKQYNDFKSLLVGGGYMERIGGNSYFTISVLWNLNDTYNSIYNNPVIRFGYLF